MEGSVDGDDTYRSPALETSADRGPPQCLQLKFSEAGFVSKISEVVSTASWANPCAANWMDAYIEPFRDRLLYRVDRGRYAVACLRSGQLTFCKTSEFPEISLPVLLKRNCSALTNNP
jgi:hypothetical protein